MSTKIENNGSSRFAIGRAIHIVREARRIRARELAQSAGLSNPLLSLIEGGQREPSLATISKIARALNVPQETFFLLACAPDLGLSCNDKAATALASAVSELLTAESKLRERLEKEFQKSASS